MAIRIALGTHFGYTLGSVGTSWTVLRAYGRRLEAVLGRLGRVLGRRGDILGAYCGILERLGDVLGIS